VAVDLQTGQVKGELAMWVNSGGCTPAAIVGSYVTASRGGDYLEMFVAEDGNWKARLTFCLSAPVAAEGLIDGTWTRLGTRHSGNLKIGRASAEVFVWNNDAVFGYHNAGRVCDFKSDQTTGFLRLVSLQNGKLVCFE
jgi:hypothetical protein